MNTINPEGIEVEIKLRSEIEQEFELGIEDSELDEMSLHDTASHMEFRREEK